MNFTIDFKEHKSKRASWFRRMHLKMFLRYGKWKPKPSRKNSSSNEWFLFRRKERAGRIIIDPIRNKERMELIKNNKLARKENFRFLTDFLNSPDRSFSIELHNEDELEINLEKHGTFYFEYYDGGWYMNVEGSGGTAYDEWRLAGGSIKINA